MNRSLMVFAALAAASALSAQAPGKFPPDSLINVKVIPKNTPVMQVVGMMRSITFALGVRCSYCHIGQEGQPLSSYDFAKDEKRSKLTARQMMRMVEEINRRIDTLPHEHDHAQPHDTVRVTCNTCHRGVSRPVPLEQLIAQTGQASGADSATRAYRALRERYYGRASYDFGEPSLNIAAFRLGRAGKFDAAFAILKLNEEYFPNSSSLSVFRGNINVMKGDTAAAIAAFREAVRRDSTNGEAQGRLRAFTRSSP